MKALSVRQPWAGLLASGIKTIEVRSWRTNYRGPILICSSKRPDPWADADLTWEAAHRVEKVSYSKKGFALCEVDLIWCRPMRPEDARLACRRYEAGLWAWVLDPTKSRLVRPFPVKGRLGLFEVATR